MTAVEIHPALLDRLSEQFDAECQERHLMGQKKYGPVKFLEVNSLQMAMQEVIDLANYARYTWIKLALMAHLDSGGTVDGKEVDHPTDVVQGPAPTTFFNPYRREE